MNLTLIHRQLAKAHTSKFRSERSGWSVDLSSRCVICELDSSPTVSAHDAHFFSERIALLLVGNAAGC